MGVARCCRPVGYLEDAAHDDLTSLVLTSRRMASIARRFLYYRLVIHDARTLVGLFRLLSSRPEIGPWISDITCVANLVGELSTEEIQQELERQAEGAANRLALRALLDAPDVLTRRLDTALRIDGKIPPAAGGCSSRSRGLHPHRFVSRRSCGTFSSRFPTRA